ncbi:hypothetical protein HYT18_03550 [Candidatus Microgenomates bacterium]|nr:hypothetical protein [Candidatus Microgenomates bacterium]
MQVRLEEWLAPFSRIKTLEDLQPGETPDVLLVADTFYLEGIGHGRIQIAKLDVSEGSLLLDLSGDEPVLNPMVRQFGRIDVLFKDLDKTMLTKLKSLILW